MIDFSPSAIGRRLAECRRAAGMSVLEAARAAVMTQRVLSAIERGGAVAPSDELLTKLAQLYGTHPAFLRYGVDVAPLEGIRVTPLFAHEHPHPPE